MVGQILCRLPPDSRDVSELGRFLKGKLQHDREPYFVIQEKHRGQHAKQLIMSLDVVERMISQSQFKMGNITIHLSSKIAETEIFLCLKDGEPHSISRFPRSLLLDEDIKDSRYPLSHGDFNERCG